MPTDASQLGTFAGLIAVVMAVVKLAEIAISKAFPGKNGKNGNGHCTASPLTDIVREHGVRLAEVQRILAQLDENGTPLVYANRRSVALLEGVLDELRVQGRTLTEQSRLLQELLYLRRQSGD